jgi:adenylate kinase
MNLLLIGLQGSGKGTQAELLANRIGLTILETGKLLRAHSQQETDSGKQVAQLLADGSLIPDDLTTELLVAKYDQSASSRGVIFDGYPRNVNQYALLKAELAKRQQHLDVVVHLQLKDTEALARLAKRRICSQCGTVYNLASHLPPTDNLCNCGGELITRSDDTPEAIKKRMQDFYTLTAPVLDRANADKIPVLPIDASPAPSEVFKAILAALTARGMVS